jgi:hypothetical protein
MQVAASVTPCQHDAGPTVLDERREANARGSAAGLGGDVAGTDQIPVPFEAAERTAKLSAPGLRYPPPAGRACGGAATLIHQPNDNACLLGLVPQRLHQVSAAPSSQAEILHPTSVVLGDALEVTHHQGAHPLLHDEGDNLPGGLMLGLVDATAMPRLRLPQPGPMSPPAA